jgi:hypothetical protein
MCYDAHQAGNCFAFYDGKEVMVNMKKVMVVLLCFLLAFSFSFTLGCQSSSDKAKEAADKAKEAVDKAKEATEKAAKEVKEVTEKAVKETKEVTSKAVEAAKEMKDKALGKTGEPAKK